MKRSPKARKVRAEKTSVPPRALWRWVALAVCLVVATLTAPRLLPAVMPDPAAWALMVATATATSALLGVAGVPCTLDQGNLLYLTNHTFRIDPGCTGVTWLLLFTIAVLLMPVTGKRKMQGLLVGLPALIILNFGRLVVVALVSEHSPASFEFVHDRIMQGGFVVATAALWAIWMWVSRNDWKPGWE